jgi:adenylate cyclase
VSREQRRLAAIVSADVAGYSRLMSRDESGTLAALKALRREIVDPKVKAHRGRIVKTTGDGLLLEFSSVVDAVRCVDEVQTAMAAYNAEVEPDRRIEFRVGVNIGDIIVDGKDIFGDGVNVAARLQELAAPGGICVSGRVQEDVRGKLSIAFEDAGEQQLKNIPWPVRIFRAGPAGATPLARVALVSADKPSIAVLPFTNMSGDPEQEYFGDGMAEDIITDLSRMPWFLVIARNTTFTFKNRAVDVKQVARELRVQYVLEGSIRKAGNRLRITAQLIDAASGNHVWAERYDRDVNDIFAVQDEVTKAIVGAVAPEFLSIEEKRAQRKSPAQLDAWECVMRGRAHLWKLSREDAGIARELFEKAIRLAPDGALGASDLALVCFLEYYYRWSVSAEDSRQGMLRMAEKAAAADTRDAWALTLLGLANLIAGRWDDSLPHIQRAIQQNPNFAPAVAMQGFYLSMSGEVAASLEFYERARLLSPRDSFMSFWLMGLVWSQYMLGRYDDAAHTAQEGIRLAPQNPSYRRQLAAALAMLGRRDDAKASLAEYLRLEPKHTLADVAKVPTRNRDHLELFLEGLRRAGLPG